MFKCIIWATDGSPSAERALPYATALCERDGAALVVVHCAEIRIGPRAGGFPVNVDQDELRAKVERQIVELAEDGYDASGRFPTGTVAGPARMVADVARETASDLIVVGTRGHSPIAGALVGSVAQRLLHVAPCPVLVVPPAALHAAAEGLTEVARAC